MDKSEADLDAMIERTKNWMLEERGFLPVGTREALARLGEIERLRHRIGILERSFRRMEEWIYETQGVNL